jgi:hypothetical protein
MEMNSYCMLHSVAYTLPTLTIVLLALERL